MASPQASGHIEKKKDRGQVTFRFCAECSNMLYPKEDEATRSLKFTCRTCQYTEEAKSWCVYRNIVGDSQMETAGVTQDVALDPTVGEASGPSRSGTECDDDDGGDDDFPCPHVLCVMCGLPLSCEVCGKESPSLGATDMDDITGDDMTIDNLGGMPLTLPLERSLAFHNEASGIQICTEYSYDENELRNRTSMLPPKRHFYMNYDDSDEENAPKEEDTEMADSTTPSPTNGQFPATAH